MKIKEVNDDSEDSLGAESSARVTDDSQDAISKARIHKLIKKAATREVFLGDYTEKRYVQKLNAFRDIVVVAHTEKQIIHRLRKIRKIVETHYGDKKWIGITNDNESPENYYLWVKFENLILGRYWFRIHSIHIEENEYFLQLKAVRPFGSNATMSDGLELPNFDINQILSTENLFTMLKFGLLLVMTIVTCLINAIPQISNFILRFMREISHFVHVCSPLVLGFYDLIARCVGGICWMIYVLIRNPNPNQPVSTRGLPAITSKAELFNRRTYPSTRSRNSSRDPSKFY